MNRREFLTRSAQMTAAMAAVSSGIAPALAQAQAKPLFNISVAQWSLHKSIFGKKIDNLDFAKTTKSLDIHAIEYVNQFFKDKAKNEEYLGEMKKRAEGEGVKSLLIMVDGEGQLGDANEANRTKAVENHYKWADAAKFLGCHSIRVNAGSSGTYQEQQQRAADGLRRLAEYCDKLGLYVIVENHGGLSSHGRWLADTLAMAKHPRVGSLPDFGNFRIKGATKDKYGYDLTYDRYLGVEELMPFARAVSAKSHEFDQAGNEIRTDYMKMMRIVLKNAPKEWDETGRYVGIEYEGGKVDELTGIKLTKALLEKVRTALA